MTALCFDYIQFRMMLETQIEIAKVNYRREYGPLFVPTEALDQNLVAQRLFLCSPRLPPKTASGKLYLQG